MATLADYGLGAEAAALLGRASTRLIYVIGDVDTGKTTLVGAVAKLLARRFKTAAVDLDAGQAAVGLPTTLAWQFCGRRRYGAGAARGMYFLGSTSPCGHFDLLIAGAAALVREASGAADKVVVDTCGLALGPAGRELHHAVIEAIGPDVLVAIQRGDELAELIEPLARSGRVRVLRAAVPAGVRARSRATRRSYRAARFRRYFAAASERVLDMAEVGVLRPQPDPAGRIASLRDARGRDIALAIVQKADASRETITVLTPLSARRRVHAVVLGTMRIARDGRQLAREI